MLGPTKCRLLTIVAGILLAHAIDSPTGSNLRLNQQLPQSGSQRQLAVRQIGLTIEHFVPSSAATLRGRNARVARNLLRPQEAFSKVDDVRFVDRRQDTASSHWAPTFGSFRYAPVALVMSSRRRSDSDVPAPTEAAPAYANSSLAFPSDNVIATPSPGRRRHNYIPLGGRNEALGDGTIATPTTRRPEEIQSRTDLNIFAADSAEGESELVPQALPLQRAQPGAKVTFADDDQAPTQSSGERSNIQGRRSGISFANQSPTFGTSFVPPSYREDDPSHPNFQVPYNEELSPTEEPEIRTARGAVYDGSYPQRGAVKFPGQSSQPAPVKQFRDDVTKFGDVNGPVTSVQRQFNDYLESQGIRTYENVYYSDDYRRPRQYYQSPPKAPYYDYSEFASQPVRSRLIVPYKSSRSPRVIFPSNDNSQGNIYTDDNLSGDNVVFRFVRVKSRARRRAERFFGKQSDGRQKSHL